MSSPRPIITIITTSHYNRICKKETRNALFLKMVLWKFSFFLINFPSAFVHVHISTNQGYVHPITTIITTSNYNRICKKKKKQTRNALFLVMVRVREFTRAFFHIHHVLFAFNLWLEVRSTNNDAAVIADHFLDCVFQIKLVRCINEYTFF